MRLSDYGWNYKAHTFPVKEGRIEELPEAWKSVQAFQPIEIIKNGQYVCWLSEGSLQSIYIMQTLGRYAKKTNNKKLYEFIKVLKEAVK